MKCHKDRILFLLIAIVTMTAQVIANDYPPYVPTSKLPNSTVYLPLPPDSASSAIMTSDFAQWVWGNSIRYTERGQLASKDSKYGISRMVEIYSGILELNINEEETPAIYRLMYRAGFIASDGVSMMKIAHFRKRPFVQMNTSVWGSNDYAPTLRNSSSYPSSHAALGWGVALALAEMVPTLQDTILRRGFDYGQSRVIVGVHWQSDVDAARVCASAAITRVHNEQDFIDDLLAAREEYLRLKGLTVSDIMASYPDSKKILDPPPSTSDYTFPGDAAQYWLAKSERTGERGEQATLDASLNDDKMLAGFAPLVDVPLNESEAPSIVMLLKVSKLMLSTISPNVKEGWSRQRPFRHFVDNTLLPSQESLLSNTSSYPSEHALVGWGVALILAQLMPSCQDQILKRGYDYGWSSVISGFAYPTDVHAGRVMADCALVTLRNNTIFNNLLASAQTEYAQLKAEQGVEHIVSESTKNPQAWYSLTGVIFSSRPSHPGIYIHSGEKVVIK